MHKPKSISRARIESREQITAAAYDLDHSLILLTTAEAGDILSVSDGLMRNARRTGKLLGRPAPPHIDISPNVVRYRLSELTAWLESVLEEATRPAAPPKLNPPRHRSTQGAQAHA